MSDYLAIIPLVIVALSAIALFAGFRL